VEIRGRVAALLELGSGFNPEYTGRENIYMNGQLLGLSREQIDERIDDIIAFAEIGEFIEQPVKTYSSGMFVRVAFAVIAHVDADILVIDEALAVGDAFFTQKCMRFLRNFMETGTILFVSHDTAAVKSLCEHAIWLEKGQMQLLGTAKDV
jgi:lipopolysaccharide transport system ATP-binding protein